MIKFNKRHLAKSLSWRAIGTIDTFIFAWLITGNIDEGLHLSGITTLTKLVWYYIHEQLWFKSSLSDSNKRHIFKTFSWRAIGTLDTVIMGWIIIGNPLIGLKIGGIESITKMLLYFGHEKMWYKINFGLDLRNKGKRLKRIQEKRKLQQK
tara:strand:+ start:164 stop:616 length:453 start_codon:yes stop_codon:yes gene_type:complete